MVLFLEYFGNGYDFNVFWIGVGYFKDFFNVQFRKVVVFFNVVQFFFVNCEYFFVVYQNSFSVVVVVDFEYYFFYCEKF